MDGTAYLGQLLVAATLACLLLALPAAAGTVATRPLWRHAPYLAPAYGSIAVGLAGFLVFFVYLLGRRPGAVVGCLVLGSCAAYLVRVAVRRQGRLTELLRGGLPVILLTTGFLVGVAGLLMLWSSPADLFNLARGRFSHPLPIDNELPAMLATKLIDGTDPTVPVGGWLSSDRPPLQTGLLVLVHSVAGRTGLGLSLQTQLFASSMVAQLAWVPAMYSAARAMRFTRWVSRAAVLFAGISGSVLVNTAFTWPKLLSAAFIISAIALAADLRHGPPHPRATVVAIGALSALGMLSHGAAVFALPIVAVLLWRARRNISWADLAVAAAASVATYAPWMLYQRFYDPPGNRLLKWHLAGVIDPDPRGVVESIVTAYSNLSFADIAWNKEQNLLYPFATPPWGQYNGVSVSSTIKAAQFFTLSGALGLALVPLALLVGAAVLRRSRGRRGASADDTIVVLASSLAAVVLWCLLLFGPATTWVHAGTHVHVLLALTLLAAWLADRSRLAFAALIGVQLGILLFVYGPGGAHGRLDREGLLTALFGAVLCGLALLPWPTTWRPTPRTAAAIGSEVTDPEENHPAMDPSDQDLAPPRRTVMASTTTGRVPVYRD